MTVKGVITGSVNGRRALSDVLSPGPRLNIRKVVLSSDLVKSRSHEIDTLNCRIALTFDRHIGSNAAEVPVKFQSDRTILNTNLAATRFHEISWWQHGMYEYQNFEPAT